MECVIIGTNAVVITANHKWPRLSLEGPQRYPTQSSPKLNKAELECVRAFECAHEIVKASREPESGDDAQRRVHVYSWG